MLGFKLAYAYIYIYIYIYISCAEKKNVVLTAKQTYFNKQFNAQFLYFIKICMLHYNS